jgi:ribosome-binding factor A
MIQINEVELTVDLRLAKIYYYTFNSEGKEEIQALLEKSKKNIRFRLANHLKNLKFAPDISFIFDDSVEKSIRIEKIFDEMKNEKKPGDEDV